ncbi:hypothetical protein AVEN_142139-1 [Araneus ventricosus]|uniref:Uncharacterized protein n=1 Tax=Araneus ventricosus TaxID=182803 RepID=A0A4Y2DIS9_ARAVE|nr:hypothetical protein AVEN_142139-1 [Araneus ventricosus]
MHRTTCARGLRVNYPRYYRLDIAGNLGGERALNSSGEHIAGKTYKFDCLLFRREIVGKQNDVHNITSPPVPLSRVLMTLYKRFEWTVSGSLLRPPTNYIENKGLVT